MGRSVDYLAHLPNASLKVGDGRRIARKLSIGLLLGFCILLAGCYDAREPIVLQIDQINLVEGNVYDDHPLRRRMRGS